MSGIEFSRSDQKTLLFVMNAQESIGRNVAAFCAQHHCPDRINYMTALYEYFSSDAPNFSPKFSSRAHDRLTGEHIVPPVSETIGNGGHVSNRVVVSLTTMPSRAKFLPATLKNMLRQTRLPDKIYVNLPDYSYREQRPYSIPDELRSFYNSLPIAHQEMLVFNPSKDYGPATKLIPTLSIESNPSTIIITIDDDIIYPESFIHEFEAASRRYPNAALGLKGYILPPIDGDDIQVRSRCPRVLFRDQIIC